MRDRPVEKLPPRRWDTVKAIGFGILLGCVAALIFAYFGVKRHNVLLFIEAMIVGAAAGGLLFGAVAALRNRI